jgi:maltose/moltooligosaccharide transporter
MKFFVGIFNLSVLLPQLLMNLVLGYFILEPGKNNINIIIGGVTLSISSSLWIFVKDRKRINN